jgi:hypothetical protein
MSIKINLFALFLFTIANCFGENNLIDSIAVPIGSKISSDNLGNLYVITPTNDIIKYNKFGTQIATVNFKVQGDVSSLDVNNPFEIYVFYRDQNKIIFLDNMLNMRGEIDMESIGVSQIACIARSSDNQIWLFDMSDQKLKKYSRDLRLVLESSTFNTFPVGNTINPTQILDINSSILLLNENRILEFDLFANFNKTVLSDTIESFQFLSDKIVYFKNNAIHLFNRLSFQSEILEADLPKESDFIRLEKERLFILKDEFVILRSLSEK